MEPKYCLQCGAPLITGLVAGRERPHCPACGFILFRNPSPVGMAVVERDGRLLLIRRANPPLQGYWAPPAGYVEVDESVETATLRETREETAMEIVIDGLQGVYSQAHTGVVIIAYDGRVGEGEPRAGEDAAEVRFFAPEEIPIQPPPLDGTTLDCWFYEVIKTVISTWHELRKVSSQ